MEISREISRHQRIKLLAVWSGVFAFRFLLVSFRAPNVEPLTASIMPLSKRFSAVACVAFASLSIVLYDAITAGIGPWTWAAALSYGILAIASRAYFAKRAASRARFVGFGVIATLLYDAATGFTVGPLFFGQTLANAFVGQIPFTILHLLSTIGFAYFLSPVIYRWVVENESFARALQGEIAVART